jgi:hypothetical protein
VNDTAFVSGARSRCTRNPTDNPRHGHPSPSVHNGPSALPNSTTKTSKTARVELPIIASRYGEQGSSPYLLPLSVDGLIIVASVSLVELAGRIRTAENPPPSGVVAERKTADAAVPASPPPVPISQPGAPHDLTVRSIARPDGTVHGLAESSPIGTITPTRGAVATSAPFNGARANGAKTATRTHNGHAARHDHQPPDEQGDQFTANLSISRSGSPVAPLIDEPDAPRIVGAARDQETGEEDPDEGTAGDAAPKPHRAAAGSADHEDDSPAANSRPGPDAIDLPADDFDRANRNDDHDDHDDTRNGEGPDDGQSLPDDVAILLPAARAARNTLIQQHRPVSRDSLAAQMRKNGHAIGSSRTTALLNLLKREPASSSNNTP